MALSIITWHIYYFQNYQLIQLQIKSMLENITKGVQMKCHLISHVIRKQMLPNQLHIKLCNLKQPRIQDIEPELLILKFK